MSDGKSLISGWSDGTIRAFLPQSGKLLYALNNAHKDAIVKCISTSADCTKILSGASDGEVRLWTIGKQT